MPSMACSARQTFSLNKFIKFIRRTLPGPDCSCCACCQAVLIADQFASWSGSSEYLVKANEDGRV